MSNNKFQMISIFNIIIGIFKKMFEFCWKTYKSLPKTYRLIFCIFLFKYKGFNPTIISKKDTKNALFSTLKQNKKAKESPTVVECLQFHSSTQLMYVPFCPKKFLSVKLISIQLR